MPELSLSNDLASLGLGPRATVDESDSDLGQGDFLKLMIAQFKNQDPFEPMDNGEFLGQLAQFGTVDGIEQLNRSFSQLSESLHTDQALQAANLVGHTVLAADDRAYLPEVGNLHGAVELSSSAQNVQVDIMDSSGQLIRRLNLGQQGPGMVEFQWDGMTDGNEMAVAGNYSIAARVIRGLHSESVETLVKANIQSVNLGRNGQGMTLNLDGGEVMSMNQVRRIL